MRKAYCYIRFSTPEQGSGYSEARQISRARDYAKSANLELDEEQTFRDLGKSGYRGQNLKGGLGEFLQAVEEGRIEQGSVLVVESLDRLSRQETLSALDLVRTILESGISIATLSSNPVRLLERGIDTMDLMMIIVEQARAHNESLVKSQRGKASWDKKRRDAQHKPLTARVPHWLVLSEDKLSIEIVKERAKLVERIFLLSESGYGKRLIARTLNSEGIPTWGSSTHWWPSYISKILKNRAVLGEYQPHTNSIEADGGPRTKQAIGPAFEDYYPSIISESLFRRVNQRLAQLNRTAGPRGRTFSNLLTGIGKCELCESSMQMVNKGKGPKGGRYLVCSLALSGGECISNHWQYSKVEFEVLSKCDEIDFKKVLNTKATNTKISQITTDIQKLEDEQAKHERRLDELKEQMLDIDRALDDGMGQVLKTLLDRKAEIRVELDQALRDKASVERSQGGDNFDQALKQLLNRLESATIGETLELRTRTNQMLGEVLSRITFDPIGPNYDASETAEWNEELGRLVEPSLPTETVTLHFRSGGERTLLHDVDYHFDRGRQGPKGNGDDATVGSP